MGSRQVQCLHLTPLPEELALSKGMLYTLLAVHFGQHYQQDQTGNHSALAVPYMHNYSTGLGSTLV